MSRLNFTFYSSLKFSRKERKKETEPGSDLEVRPQSSREDSCRLFHVQPATCSFYLMFFLSVMRWRANRRRPPCITAPADERIIRSLIFNFSLLSLFKTAVSCSASAWPSLIIICATLSLSILHLSPLPPPTTLSSSSLSAACQTFIWPP